jgi:hypothetical protein
VNYSFSAILLSIINARVLGLKRSISSLWHEPARGAGSHWIIRWWTARGDAAQHLALACYPYMLLPEIAYNKTV